MLIPTQLVVDTCYATFVKLEADKLGEAETKKTWEQRLAMIASNRDADEGEQEAFVVSKYDLLPESLADMVQVSLSQSSLMNINEVFNHLHSFHDEWLVLCTRVSTMCFSGQGLPL